MSKIKLSYIGITILFFCATVFIACTTSEEQEDKTALNANLNTENVLKAKWKNFEESIVIMPSNRVSSKTKKSEFSAKSFVLENYNPDYIVDSIYIINGVDFTDNGLVNDVKAGDGIYTSVESLPNLKITSKKAGKKAIFSNSFKYKDKFANQSVASKFMITCKMRVVHSGKSLLGFSCKGGCIELYDCSVEMGWD